MTAAIFESDGAGSVVFPIDFGGDASPEYRCRITAQDTLACLIDVYRQGVEFRKMSVDPRDLYARANRLLVDGSNAWHGSSGVGRGIAGRVLSDWASVLNRYTPFFVGGSTKPGVG